MIKNNLEKRSKIFGVAKPQNSYCQPDGEMVKIPDNIHVPSFDAGSLAMALSNVEVDLKEEKEGNVKTARMEWVQQTLDELSIRYSDTKYVDSIHVNSFATIVPFITDFAEPATIYVAPTNIQQSNRKNIGDRLSGIIMGLALIAQLNKSSEYRNVIIIYMNMHHVSEAAYMLEKLIQTRTFKTSVSEIIELGYFIGESTAVESCYDTIGAELFRELISRAGLNDAGIAPSGDFHHCIGDHNYASAIYESYATEQQGGHLSEEDEDKIFSVEHQVKFCTSRAYLTLYRILYQHAVLMSSYYRDNDLDTQLKH